MEFRENLGRLTFLAFLLLLYACLFLLPQVTSFL